jgi:outer membrane murein-binding lipoprotein Lpp
MPLIVQGETKIISKSKMNELANKLATEKDSGIDQLSPDKKAIREEVKSAKRHREFMDRVRANEELNETKRNAIAHAESVSELVVDSKPVATVIEPAIVNVIVSEEAIVETSVKLPDFDSMTKSQIGIWSEEHIGLTLDLRKTKYDLIDEIKNAS